MFVPATVVERAGMCSLAESQKAKFDTHEDRRTGKIAWPGLEAPKAYDLPKGDPTN